MVVFVKFKSELGPKLLPLRKYQGVPREGGWFIENHRLNHWNRKQGKRLGLEVSCNCWSYPLYCNASRYGSLEEVSMDLRLIGC